ncbi:MULTISPECIES: DNA cytosine methyltransferase [unclassified Dysgonomonas]|uniref:DNA cytosine methyltransferase n=1 Tax=unclassified Dysgonomonas TaxID=2630389 RepID=UPI0025BA1B30|nr:MULTISPECIES: DNA cytosine methyltransferase [unclassified Dysgonomonas]HMM02006.1 DNA cytosine methyltransferase [Dysgonomonas sp.]
MKSDQRHIHTINPLEVRLIVIDSFCGAGGVTYGFCNAKVNGKQSIKVIIGINHDRNAILSFKENHPDTHCFIEDFRSVNVLQLLPIIEEARRSYPNAKLMFHMSAECTHHSIAKGGMSRDADSRSLPEAAYRYIEILKPDIISVENVKEFIKWGPLKIKVITDKQGNELYCPLERKKREETEIEKQARKARKERKKTRYGYLPVWVPVKECVSEFYNAWRDKIKSYGYHYDYRLLNAADYGAYTSRIRYFGYFATDPSLIVFPAITHTKDGRKGTKKYKEVKDVLDFSDEGTSIFARTKPYEEPTLSRVHSGLVRFVAGGKDAFLLKYNSMNRSGKYIAPGVNEPCPTVATQNRLGVCFLSKAFSGHPDSKNIPVNGPAASVTTVDHHQFISAYYSPGINTPVKGPIPTVRTKDCFSLVSPRFLTAYYGNGFCSPVNESAKTVTVKDRFSLVSPYFLCSYNDKKGSKPLDKPCPTVLTKDHFSLVQPQFLDQQYGCSKPASVLQPCGSLTANPKFNLISCNWLLSPHFSNPGTSLEVPAPVITAGRKWHYLVNPQYSSEGASVDAPCFTLIARMDKKPPSLVEAASDTDALPSFIRFENGIYIYEIYESDTPMTKAIKEFMALYGIVDIKMRMLKIIELLRIMGFPEDYVLIGTQADQKKFIGNAVECTQAQVNGESLSMAVDKLLNVA